MKKYLAEGIGTFLLVFAGTGSVIVNSTYDSQLGLVGISLVFGLAVMTIIYAIGDVSGAHINPAVTIALWFGNRLPKSEVLPYVASQCLGALAASSFLKLLYPNHLTLGSTLPSNDVDIFHCFTFEVLLTFFLMFVIMGFVAGTSDKGSVAGAAIGGVVCLDVFVGGPVTGASMNPARSLGPAIVSGNLELLWIYLLAPVAGAILAIVASRAVHGPPAESGSS